MSIPDHSAKRLGWLSADARLILAARAARALAYSFLSVFLGVYLEGIGLKPSQIGALLTTVLVGSASLTALVSLVADRLGRRRVLVCYALLMAGAGLVLALSTRFPLLLLAALTGTVAVTGGEAGPFLAIEQAVLPQTVAAPRRNRLFGLYNTVGALAGALGALGGALPKVMARWGVPLVDAYRLMLGLYVVLALVALVLLSRLSGQVEVERGAGPPALFGLSRSRGVVARLSMLFALDSLAGGFVVQSLVAYWFHLRFGVGTEVLGPVFFGVGLLQAISFLVAARLADRIGLIPTMVFTHL
ncbi:MAG: MFS transporter, partial [Deinococcus sp.]|nr:MFS transporter [Deinococcus sp.]